MIDLNSLDPKKRRKLQKLYDLTQKGNVAVLEYLMELEDKMDEEMPTLRNIMGKVKGEKGDTGERGMNGRDGIDGRDGQDGKDGKDGKNGLNGKDGKDGKDGEDGRDGKDGKDGKDGSPDTGEQIIEKINSSNGIIKKERVEGLNEEFSRLETKIDSRPVGNMGMRKVPIIKVVNLTSYVDGSTRTFRLPKDTVAVLGVWGTQFPVVFDPSVDWTLTGNTLTLGSSVTTPVAGQTLFALIEVLFYG